MKLPRFFLALSLVAAPVPAFVAPSASAESVTFASDIAARDTDPARASRSEARTVVAQETTTTTLIAPTTTSTTTAAPKPAVAAKRSAPKTQAVATSSSTGGNTDVVNVARAQVGKAYRMGAVGPNAFDCSGLIIYAYKNVGVSLPRLTSEDFPSRYPRVSRASLQPGDVVYRPGHVGLYVGNGQMVHASTPRGGVKISPIDSSGTPTAFVRIAH